VSYLNARPLIEELDNRDDLAVRFDVPSRLLAGLESGDVDMALCPAIDYYRASVPLEVVPVGAIGSKGPTVTVRLYSQVPIDRIQVVHADNDSHSSVALLRVLLDEIHGLRPQIVDYDARKRLADPNAAANPETILLIGDKVIATSPDPASVGYVHQLDLGQAWQQLTALPFVFAVWMSRRGADLGDLPATLNAQRQINMRQLGTIAQHHATAHGWPVELAQRYLTQIMRYTIGGDELAAIERFAASAHRLKLIDQLRPLYIRQIED